MRGWAPLVFECGGCAFGVLICEDAWFDEPAAAARGRRRRCCACSTPRPSTSTRPASARRAWPSARAPRLPLLYAHLVGGQDEVVFDGASFAVDAGAWSRARARASRKPAAAGVEPATPAAGAWRRRAPEPEAQAWQALVTGVRDYLGKNGFPGAIIGLSGGIDSALVLAIAVDALGADKVRTVMMPSPYTADISWIDARDMAARLGVRYDEIAIAPMFDAFRGSLAPQFAGLPRTPPKRTCRPASAARC
jgi:NAD+ synthase (glutamine-hydrolysing)